MSYRRNDPSWNILLAGVLSLAGCDGGKGAAPAGGAATAPQGQKAPSASPLRFDPETEDHSDLAVGETVFERIALRSETPFDWKLIEFTSSCECLNVRFVDTSDSKHAVVELTFQPSHVEDIDGVIEARDFSKESLAKDKHGEERASYTAKIVASRIPFVTPRSIVLEKGGAGRFDLIVGQALAPKSDALHDIFEDIHFDEAKLELINAPRLDATITEEYVLLRTKVILELQEAARAAAFTTKVTLKFGVPAVERTVEVQWK